MDVSTFEILYKPLTPPLGAGTEAIARRVLQGYFLTLANLEEQDFTFGVEFRITLPNPDNPSRRLDSNALFISDVGGAPDNVFQTSLTRSPVGGNRYATSVRVGAGRTALLVLLPNITTVDFFTTRTPDVEIRGRVSLTLPCAFRRFGRFFVFGPQSDRPVRVLLNAEHRSTFLPPGWPAVAAGTELDFDQTGTNVMLASGMGLNEVPPETGCLLHLPTLDVLPERLPVPIEGSPAEAAIGILAGLARLSPDRENLGAISKLLQDSGIPIRLEPAGPPRKG